MSAMTDEAEFGAVMARLQRRHIEAEARASSWVRGQTNQVGGLLGALVDQAQQARWRAIEEGRWKADAAAPLGQLLERVVDGHLLAEVTRCGRCDDSGALPGSVFDEHGYETPQACPCTERRRVAGWLNAARIPADRAVPTAQTWCRQFDGDSPADVRGNERAFKAVGRLDGALGALRDDQPLPRGIVLAGSPGLGKTHLIGALLRSVAQGPAAAGLARRARRAEARLSKLYASERIGRSVRVQVLRYWAWPECMQSLFKAMRAKQLELELDELAAVPVLALDEFGAGAPSDFEQQTLSQLMVARHQRGTCTVIGTNYLLTKGKADDPGTYLGSRLGEHAMSRLGVLEAVTLSGADRRPLIENNRVPGQIGRA